MLKLSDEESKRILFFQQVTGAAARDAVEENGQFIFVVAEGDMSKAIGKNGRNVELMKKLMKRELSIVEYSDNLIKFVENIFFPIKVNVEKQGEKEDRIILTTDKENRKFIIGKEGKKIRIAKILLERHFGIKDVKIV